MALLLRAFNPPPLPNPFFLFFLSLCGDPGGRCDCLCTLRVLCRPSCVANSGGGVEWRDLGGSEGPSQATCSSRGGKRGCVFNLLLLPEWVDLRDTTCFTATGRHHAAPQPHPFHLTMDCRLKEIPVCWTVAGFQARLSVLGVRFCVQWVCAVCPQRLGQHAAAAWLLFAHLLEPLPLFANDYFAPSVCVSAQLSHSSSTGLHTCTCASPSPPPPKCHFSFAFEKNIQPWIKNFASKRMQKFGILMQRREKNVFGVWAAHGNLVQGINSHASADWRQASRHAKIWWPPHLVHRRQLQVEGRGVCRLVPRWLQHKGRNVLGFTSVFLLFFLKCPTLEFPVHSAHLIFFSSPPLLIMTPWNKERLYAT